MSVARHASGTFDADARRDFGQRGAWDCGTRAIAYAWCARGGHYHYADVRANTRIPTHGKAPLRWKMNASQSRTNKTVRVATIATARNPRVRALAVG